MAMERRPGIAAYLRSAAAFPYTQGELGREGGYVYADGKVVSRADARGEIKLGAKRKAERLSE